MPLEKKSEKGKKSILKANIDDFFYLRKKKLKKKKSKKKKMKKVKVIDKDPTEETNQTKENPKSKSRKVLY